MSIGREFSLRDWEAVAGYAVVRDASFAQLGLMRSRQPKTLFPFFDGIFAHEIDENPDLAAAVTTPELAALVPARCGVAICAEPMAAFLRIHSALAADEDYVGLGFPTRIGPRCRIDAQANVAERGVVIGADGVVGPHATIFPGAVIGERVTIQAGAVVSGQGFEVREVEGRLREVEHIGRAVIGDDVLIGYQTIVDRAVFREETLIGDSTKIGPLVIIGHGCRVGRRCRITSRVTVAGATVLGDDVVVGPSATISNALTVGNRARIVLGEVVTRDVPDDMVAFGSSVVSAERYRDICALGAKIRTKPV